MPPKAAAPNPLQAIRLYDFFDGYRNLVRKPLTFPQLEAQRQTNYVAPPPPPPPPVIPAAPAGQAGQAGQAAPAALDPQVFLGTRLAQLDTWQASNWVGTKILGSGTNGMVGLWEYLAPRRRGLPLTKQVAVKQTSRPLPDAAIEAEARHLMAFKPLGEEHVVELLVTPPRKNAADQVERLILEYCPMGSLKTIRERFIARDRQITEISLWLMFDCLVDGISLLEFGAEPTFTGVDNMASVTPTKDWRLKIHFDLKPGNVLAVQGRRGHSQAPLCMLADFGSTLDRRTWNKARKTRMRTRGTPRFLAPEQFAPQWDYLNWNAGGVAGEYETEKNVWGIGCIMYSLLTLQSGPDQRQPFLPTWTLNGDPPAGIVYGHDLNSFQGNPYSGLLTDLIQQCLYDVPAHRPSVLELKDLIRAGLQAARAAGALRDDWANFMPDPPPGAKRARRRPGHRCQAQGIGGNSTRCRNIIAWRGGAWCHLHRP